MSQEHDPNVHHPQHYGGNTVYEVIKVIEAWGLCFHLGNAVKYIARAGHKDPAKECEDLEKSIWYIRRKIARLRGKPDRADMEDAVSSYLLEETGVRVVGWSPHPRAQVLLPDEATGARYPTSFSEVAQRVSPSRYRLEHANFFVAVEGFSVEVDVVGSWCSRESGE